MKEQIVYTYAQYIDVVGACTVPGKRVIAIATHETINTRTRTNIARDKWRVSTTQVSESLIHTGACYRAIAWYYTIP